MAKLYEYLAKYATSSIKDVTKNAIYTTKSHVINAYAILEKNDKNAIKEELSKAEQSFMPIINNINAISNNQASINKAYILIKDLQNNTDNDVFYIKYKNLMQELENIKG